MSECIYNGFAHSFDDNYVKGESPEHQALGSAAAGRARHAGERYDVCFEHVQRRLDSGLEVRPQTFLLALVPSSGFKRFLGRYLKDANVAHLCAAGPLPQTAAELASIDRLGRCCVNLLYSTRDLLVPVLGSGGVRWSI
ncbi:MAG: hypothetical protein WD793_15135 [Steroidobacteraceae bacterium]